MQSAQPEEQHLGFLPETEIPSATTERELPRALTTGDFSDFSFASHKSESNAPSDSWNDKRLLRATSPWNLNTSSGLHRYDERTQQLLARYFEGNIEEPESRELAGALLFPSLPDAAALAARQIQGGLSPQEEVQLQAAAIYPDNKRAGELLYKKCQTNLQLGEAAELYGLQAFGDSNLLASQLARETVRVLTTISDGKTTPEQTRKLLLNFVKREIDLTDRMASSVEDLANLFQINPEMVQSHLGDAKFGLSPEQRAVRDERLLISAEALSHSMNKLRINAVRNIVAIENELHRTGHVEVLSGVRDLAKLFGVGVVNMQKFLRLLPESDFDYREKCLATGDLAEKKKQITDAVRRELAAYRSNRTAPVRSDMELARDFGVGEATVYHCINARVPKPERELREFVLRAAKPVSAMNLCATAFARAELEALKKGEISRLSTAESLAQIFRVTPQVLNQALSDPATGLSAEERRARAFVLSLQKEFEPSLEALRCVSIAFLKDNLEKQRSRLRGETTPRATEETEAAKNESGTNFDSRPRKKLEFRGFKYDSYEEAVCSVMLQKYVPGFVPVEGKTLQVDMNGRFLDFILDGVVVEYHPILPFWSKSGVGAFRSRNEYENFNRIKMGIRSIDKRKMFIEETKAQLGEVYRQERQAIIDANPALRGYELVVAESPEDFYYAVIKRFGDSVPSKPMFMREFAKVKAKIRKENS
jgi:hypothetical protein